MSRLKHLAKVRRTNNRFFIAHVNTTRDKAFAICLYRSFRLVGLNGFVDAISINPGQHFPNEINRGLKSCHLFILVLSREANKSVWVAKEIDYAISLQGKQGRPVIIPILIEKCESSVQWALLSTQWIAYYRLPLVEALEELFHKGLKLSKRRVQSNVRTLLRLFWLAEVAPENKGDVFRLDPTSDFIRSNIFKYLKQFVFKSFTGKYRDPMTNSWAENDLRDVLRHCLGRFLGKDSLGTIAKGQSFPRQLESEILREANGSIERMFRLVDLLFDNVAHRWARSHRVKMITRADWKVALRKVAG